MHILSYIHDKKIRKHRMQTIDRIMMVLAFVHPLTGLPQVIDIYTSQQVEGVSLLSWCGFLAFGLIYLYYAIVHSLKPLIITQTLWAVVDILVIVGVILYR